MKLQLGDASCHLNWTMDGSYFVSCLGVYQEEQRRKGHAKKLIRAVRKWADRNNKIVHLTARPYSHSPIRGGNLPDLEALVNFYSKMGFKPLEKTKSNLVSRYQEMVYYPKGLKQ